jgi:hypothetical protein
MHSAFLPISHHQQVAPSESIEKILNAGSRHKYPIKT